MHGYSDRINHAFAFAAKYYVAVAPAGAGMDYLAHPANVAIILARYGCEQVTIVAGILHHVLEETPPDRGRMMEHKISDKFGPVVLAVAKDALEPKFDRRGGERPWQACKQEYLSQLGDRGAAGARHLRRRRDPRLRLHHHGPPPAGRRVPANGVPGRLGPDDLVVPVDAGDRLGARRTGPGEKC